MASLAMALTIFPISFQAKAQQLIDEGTGAGVQCTSNDVNDGGVEVGTCQDATAGLKVAYAAVTEGFPRPCHR